MLKTNLKKYKVHDAQHQKGSGIKTNRKAHQAFFLEGQINDQQGDHRI